ncbi:hypothetical protein MTO96_023329 [Rhipicephalus appendiculatus]
MRKNAAAGFPTASNGLWARLPGRTGRTVARDDPARECRASTNPGGSLVAKEARETGGQFGRPGIAAVRSAERVILLSCILFLSLSFPLNITPTKAKKRILQE